VSALGFVSLIGYLPNKPTLIPLPFCSTKLVRLNYFPFSTQTFNLNAKTRFMHFVVSCCSINPHGALYNIFLFAMDTSLVFIDFCAVYLCGCPSNNPLDTDITFVKTAVFPEIHSRRLTLLNVFLLLLSPASKETKA
jgi:hypothetical protein